MTIHPIPHEQSAVTGATHLCVITYADLTASGNTQTLSPINVASKIGVEVVAAQLATPFVSSDGTLISTAITVGDGGSATRFLSSTELNAAGSYVSLKGGTLVNTSLPYAYATDDTVDVFVTGTAAKALNTHTAGELWLWVKITDAR